MFVVQSSWHRRFLIRELKTFFVKGSFAALFALRIGRELHGTLVEYVEDDRAFSSDFPVQALFNWLCGGWNLDIEWLANPDGSFSDSAGNAISPELERTCSSIEQLAAYGIYLLVSEFYNPGLLVPEPQTNEQGWSREDVQQHRAECVLQAYQALVFAQTLRSGMQPDAAELEKATRAALARKAADARHIENRAMKADVIAWCDANMRGFAGSMDDAALLIAEKVVPLKFRAVREHITAWKRMRSAGKA